MHENKAAQRLFVRNLNEGVTLGNHTIEIWGNKLHHLLTGRDREASLSKNAPNGYLRSADITTVIPKIFDDVQARQNTFVALDFDKNPDIHKLKTRISHLQTGLKAYIFFVETSDPATGKSIYYVIYLSRGPAGSYLGNEAIRDFSNLQKLNELAEEKIIDPEIKSQYQFIKPLSQGKTSSVNGRQYSFYTTPFIEGFGELRFNNRPIANVVVDGKITTASVPYFSYAGPPTDEYKQLHADHIAEVNQVELMAISLLAAKNLRMSERDYYKVYAALNRLPFYEKLRNQLLQVLFGNALIYALTNGSFPKEFAVNAGDWMADLQPDSTMKLFFTTVRGGWKKFASDKDWIRHIKEYVDMPGDEGGYSSQLFMSFTNEEIQSIIDLARSTLKK